MKREADVINVTLLSIFLSVFGIFANRYSQRHSKALDLTRTDLALLAVSTFRLGRLVAYDKVFAPLREPVAVTKPDASGAAIQRHRAVRELGEHLESLSPVLFVPAPGLLLFWFTHFIYGPGGRECF